MAEWIGRLLMALRVPYWRRKDQAAAALGARAETEQNTLETDRQIGQIVQSAARQTERTERRAERSAAVLRHMAEQACILSDATRSGRNP